MDNDLLAQPHLAELIRLYSPMYDIEVDDHCRVILTPKLTAAASDLRLGSSQPVTDEEFEAAFGDLPTGPR